MKFGIAVYAGLLAAFIAVLAPISTLTPVFAAEVEAEIRPGSSSLTTDAYAPNPLEIKVGDTVTWTNKDSTPHTVTSGKPGMPDGHFDSSPNFNPLMGPQQKFSHTFTQAGEFPYYCGLHPNMVGLVIVLPADSAIDGGPMTPTSFSITATDRDGNKYEIKGSGDATAKAVTIFAGESVKIDFDGSGAVELALPKDMVRDITAVMAGSDNIQYEVVSEDATHTTISFKVPEGKTSVQIMAGFVVPEFPVIAAILATTVAAIVAYTRFARSGTGFFARS